MGLSLVVALIGLLSHAPPGFAASGDKALSVLVMGDSYSAGNGAGDYYGSKGCWRSRKNYAAYYASLVEAPPYSQRATVTNVACSGATTSWFFNSMDGRPPELDAVNKTYDAIFLTVGGNDIDFAGIVQNCLIQISRHGLKCNALLSAAEKDVGNGTLEGHVIDVLDGVRRRASAKTRIVLLGYPYIEGQETYRLPYGHNKSIDVPERLRTLQDLGDRAQRQAIEQLDTRYHTNDFIFVKTKALFAGHELDALTLNPNRWFIAPETDAGIAWKAWWYHPNPTGWYEEAQLLLRNPQVPKHPIPIGPRPPVNSNPMTCGTREGLPVLAYNMSCSQAAALLGAPNLPPGWSGANSDIPVGHGLPNGQAILYRTADAATVQRARLPSGKFSVAALHGAPVLWFAVPYGE